MRRIQNILATTLLCASTVVAVPAFAEQRPVVVELYTSQGCSSCPPADAIFTSLNDREDVIAIALHVDYWDYIGWKDEFSNPAYAERQRAYARNAGRRSIYTPEMVVNGLTDIVGAKPMALADAINDHKSEDPQMTLDVTRHDGKLSVAGSVPVAANGPMEIHVLQLTPLKASKITRGENRGKTITYSNIAHDWRVVGSWDGKSALDMSVDVKGDDPVVVLVQEANAGIIVAAARVE
ncbi:MAG: DUF1223 domain-containing protein [Sulfitobacter sp.]